MSGEIRTAISEMHAILLQAIHAMSTATIVRLQSETK
jgi:hypothetical protein